MFNGLAVLSLVLCVVAAALWIWSYERALYLSTYDPAAWVMRDLLLSRGRVELTSISGLRPEDTDYLPMVFGVGYDIQDQGFMRPILKCKHRFLGFSYGEQIRPLIVPADLLLVIPLWFLTAVAATLPTVRLLRFLHYNRLYASGGCEKCSYNLTGNVSGVCPECGSPISKKAELSN